MTDYASLAAQFGGAPADDYTALAQSFGGQPVKRDPYADALLQQRAQQMSEMSGPQRFLAGMGSGMTDLYLGAKQRMGLASNQDVANKRTDDAPLLATPGGGWGAIAGQSMPALATLPIPGLNTLVGAAGTGAVLGGLQPTTGDEKVGNNIAMGGVGGLIGQAGANVVGRAIAPIRSMLNPEQQRLAQVFSSSGVPLDLAQQTGSKPLSIVNAVLEKLPFTSAAEGAKTAEQNQAFTKAVMSKVGESSDTASPEAMAAAQKRLQDNYNMLYGRNTVTIDNPLLHSITETLQKTDSAPPIVAKADKILSSGPEIPGQKYQDIRTQLRNLQGSTDPETRSGARDLKYAMDAAAARSFAPDDAALLADTRRQYGNLQLVTRAMKSPAGVNGEVPPLALRQAVANSDPAGYVASRGDLTDLARAGSQFLRPYPTSGSAERLLYQGALTGGLGALTGTGGYFGSGQDPVGAAGGAAAGLLASSIAPVAVQKALTRKFLQNYLAASANRGLLGGATSRYLAPPLMGMGAGLLTGPQ